DRSSNGADATQQRRRKRLEADDVPHEKTDAAVIDGVDQAGDAGQGATQRKGVGDRAIDIDAEHRRHARVLSHRADLATETAADENQPEGKADQNREADDDALQTGDMGGESGALEQLQIAEIQRRKPMAA